MYTIMGRVAKGKAGEAVARCDQAFSLPVRLRIRICNRSPGGVEPSIRWDVKQAEVLKLGQGHARIDADQMGEESLCVVGIWTCVR